MNATTTRPTIARWDRRKDKYGRGTHVAITFEGGEYGEQALVGAVVTMPKRYRELNLATAYLVNCWGKGTSAQGEVSYHSSLKAAKAHFAANALTVIEYRAR